MSWTAIPPTLWIAMGCMTSEPTRRSWLPRAQIRGIRPESGQMPRKTDYPPNFRASVFGNKYVGCGVVRRPIHCDAAYGAYVGSYE